MKELEIFVQAREDFIKITDIYSSCSVDYDKDSEITKEFFKTVQNKLRYAITGNTAAEIIYNRVDSEKKNMGLTNWKNSPDGPIYKYDVVITKNYLNEKEILCNAGKISASVAQELAYKEYDKFKVKQDKLYKSDFDNFLDKARIIENGSD